jgi:hypothetical protein
MVKKFSASYGTKRFITVFTRASIELYPDKDKENALKDLFKPDATCYVL